MRMEKRLYEVEGFSFYEEGQVKQAEKEIAGIKYIKSKMDMENPEMILQIYNKTIREKLFETPVGFSYLKDLQEYLHAVPYIKDSDILPIPAYRIVNVEQQIEPKQQKAHKQIVVKEKNIDFKKRYRVTLFFSVIFFVMIVGMFAVSFTSDSTTILNYENQIINKYETWEQELDAREQELDAREQALRAEK